MTATNQMTKRRIASIIAIVFLNTLNPMTPDQYLGLMETQILE